MVAITKESMKYHREIEKKQKEMGEDYALIDETDGSYFKKRAEKLGLDEEKFRSMKEYARLESEITPRKFSFGCSSILEDFPMPNFRSYTDTLLWGMYKHPQKVIDKLKEYPDIYKKYKETFPEVYDLLKEEGLDV